MEKAGEPENKSSATELSKDDVANSVVRAPIKHEKQPKAHEDDIPLKKRKTRRGKSKRRNIHPYKTEMKGKLQKPEAPYNSNRFLIEDHGNMEELDERLKNADQISIKFQIERTRDSSVSVDTDGEFYSTPDDEEEYLIKDFDDQYETLQAERFQSMPKSELIQEYLQLENKVELLTKRLRIRSESLEGEDGSSSSDRNYQEEINRLLRENEALRRENDSLKSQLSRCSSSSEDSETDSTDSCSSTSSSASSLSTPSSPLPDYPQTNGTSPSLQTV